MTESTRVFRRYTDLASLLDLLRRKAITLLPPDTWDDRNDRLMMQTYADCRKLGTLRALCLTSRGETYHHWKVFTDRSNGVCIQFLRQEFTEAMRAAGVRVRKVKYLKLDELDGERPPIARLPFLKRFGYGDEGEYRAVYENEAVEEGPKRVKVDLAIIERISLNPWMPKPVFESVRAAILDACGEFACPVISHSSLIESQGWREFARRYKAKSHRA
ncbi:DUF2971 domain-containing protein [Acidovorax sp. YS12]|nr:DUF2971 domain-containing protein [Acidovorax sp. YS12]